MYRILPHGTFPKIFKKYKNKQINVNCRIWKKDNNLLHRHRTHRTERSENNLKRNKLCKRLYWFNEACTTPRVGHTSDVHCTERDVPSKCTQTWCRFLHPLQCRNHVLLAKTVHCAEVPFQNLHSNWIWCPFLCPLQCGNHMLLAKTCTVPRYISESPFKHFSCSHSRPL